MSAYEPEIEEALQRFATTKYAVLSVDVSSTHDDVDLANIATHHPSGDAFSWDEFTAIIFVTDRRHTVNFELKYNDTGNDADFYSARGDGVEHLLGITKIFFSNDATDATPVLLLLEGY